MALSYRSVQIAYEVFHELKAILPELIIESWPQDMSEWTSTEQENPPLNRVLGWGKKYDSGWESISFFCQNPSNELISKFEELKKRVPNTSLSKPYHRNEDLYVIGWF